MPQLLLNFLSTFQGLLYSHVAPKSASPVALRLGVLQCSQLVKHSSAAVYDSCYGVV